MNECYKSNLKNENNLCVRDSPEWQKGQRGLIVGDLLSNLEKLEFLLFCNEPREDEWNILCHPSFYTGFTLSAHSESQLAQLKQAESLAKVSTNIS